MFKQTYIAEAKTLTITPGFFLDTPLRILDLSKINHNVEKLIINYFINVECVILPKNYHSIKKLELMHGQNSQPLDFIRNLTNLEEMSLVSIEILDGFKNVLNELPKLRKLRYYACRLTNLNFLDYKNCFNIEYLNLNDNYLLKDIKVHHNFTNLKYLNLAGCRLINDLTCLTNLTKLRTLYLDGCTQINNIGMLFNLPLIKTNINYCGCIDSYQANKLLVHVINNIAISFLNEQETKKSI